MTIQPMDTQGPYIPFEKPVPVPGSLAYDEPLSHICFNSDWLPAVVGALKVLCRPETWQGTSIEIKAATSSAFSILAANSIGCSDLECPAFSAYQRDIDDTFFNVTGAYLDFISGCDGCNHFYPTSFWGFSPLVADFASLAWEFLDNSSGIRCGGKVCEIAVKQSDSTIGNVFTLTWLDCLGNQNQEIHAGLGFRKQNFDAQWVCVSALAHFSLSFTIVGPVLCGAA